MPPPAAVEAPAPAAAVPEVGMPQPMEDEGVSAATPRTILASPPHSPLPLTVMPSPEGSPTLLPTELSDDDDERLPKEREIMNDGLEASISAARERILTLHTRVETVIHQLRQEGESIDTDERVARLTHQLDVLRAAEAGAALRMRHAKLLMNMPKQWRSDTKEYTINDDTFKQGQARRAETKPKRIMMAIYTFMNLLSRLRRSEALDEIVKANRLAFPNEAIDGKLWFVRRLHGEMGPMTFSNFFLAHDKTYHVQGIEINADYSRSAQELKILIPSGTDRMVAWKTIVDQLADLMSASRLRALIGPGQHANLPVPIDYPPLQGHYSTWPCIVWIGEHPRKKMDDRPPPQAKHQPKRSRPNERRGDNSFAQQPHQWQPQWPPQWQPQPPQAPADWWQQPASWSGASWWGGQ
jgi:hypothetical protein